MHKITITLTDETMQALNALVVKKTASYADLAAKYEAKGNAELAETFKRPPSVESVATGAIFRVLRQEGLIID